MLSLCTMACSDILDETPRASYEPGYFSTKDGVNGGVTSLYTHLRYIYGQGYYYNSCETGTDEYTYGGSADGNFKDADLSGVGQLTPSTCRADAIWGICFSNINTASGIIENAEGVGLDKSIIAEAYFFRAFDYFLLVQTFGGVPLDLGSGELKMNSSKSRTSVRNTVPEVYAAIFNDLQYAVENLPVIARKTGTATKTLARLYLAKAYLTFGWWLESSIPTYPECSRTAVDGKSAAQYFQMAYDMAMEGINSPGSAGLQDNFYKVNAQAYDRNKEILLYADHTADDEYYNGSAYGYSGGGAPDNFAHWMVNCNYANFKAGNGQVALDREAGQAYGRPWTRMAPTINVFKSTFADKTNDSRYDGTFVTCFRANYQKAGKTSTPVDLLGNKVVDGDAVLTFLDEDVAGVTYASDNAGVNAGKLAGRADWVIEPSKINRTYYPTLWKLGYNRGNENGMGTPNGASSRPYSIAKFSELYFVAAEAAVKGATGAKTARELINVIRARAGKWSFCNAANAAKVADNSAAMTDATPAVITIDYILAERSREYFGEGYRWYDLVRTQKWAELSSSYQICEFGSTTPTTKARTIENYMYLRPIPQGQIDGLEMTEAEKKAYQNPGY